MPYKSFLPVLRELARTYQAFEFYSAEHIRQSGLTPPQFDIIATLGNTDGMRCKELCEKTLITKGTLTGVLDRLETKGLVRRTASSRDGRSQNVQLTRKGAALFARVFPEHMEHIGKVFAAYPQTELDTIAAVLRELHAAFSGAAGNSKSAK